MFNSHSSPTMINCTFSGNAAPVGGGIYNVGAGSNPTITNCILWSDGPEEIVDVDGAQTTVRFSDVQGGWPGQGNIDANPLFGDPAGRLAPGSPCIDTGDPAMQPPGGRDLDGNMRVWNARVDMGAYEFGLHPFGDINCDGAIDALDIEPFLVALFEPQSYAGQYPDCDINLADINVDGSIDALDIEHFLNLLFP
ncbi:MAG: hypothetical protein IID33_08200 [Planctomycetes bacterium]|nr:hypothetical protein [Planctomycetota bacterium]